MAKKDELARIHDFIDKYRITNGKNFKIKDFDPADTQGMESKEKAQAKEMLVQGVGLLAELQDKLYAQNKWGVLLVIQAMDAAGKDSTIKHVMSGVNPQGVQVYSFKEPSHEELDHDFMWRHIRCLPERGRIGIFNRSYYEDVLVVRVHNLLSAQNLPQELISKNVWDERLEDIANYEKYLARNGVVPVKIFLNVSREEQKKRFLARLDRPEKNWKFAPSDVSERHHWIDYMSAYEEAIRATAAKHSPWYIVPADNKWFARLVVAAIAVDTIERLKVEYPALDKVQIAKLEESRAMLMKE